jgi:hypothetical protein
MKNKFIEECIILLKKDENVKTIINPIIEPIISSLLKELNPYIYLSLVFVFISFLLHLGIFFLLVSNKLTHVSQTF